MKTHLFRPRSYTELAAVAAMILAATSFSHAQGLITQRTLSELAAVSVAQEALDRCHADGYRVSVTVLDASGLVKVQIRGDGTGPHTLENGRRKAYTALTFKRTSAETAQQWASSGTPPPLIEGTVALGGGVPIKAGNEIIGAVGVSGGPGADKDEACANAGIAKIEDLLK
jgi:uncharacterized protein GlcG (DUF336 family)